MVAGLNAVRARLGGRSVWRARHRRGRPRPTKRRPRSSGSPSGWHHALVAAGTTTCATTSTAAAARSATFRRAVGPRRAGRCVRSTKGARIVAGLRSRSVRRRVWSARCRTIDCRARAGSARLRNAVACGIDLRRARIRTALCECRSNHQCCCRNCYQRLLHIVLVRFHAPSWMN